MELLHAPSTWLNGTSRQVYSQFGEDGLIEACIEHFGAQNRWCFEVGAGNGVALSNTKLLRDQGWNAVLIEADAEVFKLLVSQDNGRVRCVEERIGPDSLDRILRERGAPQDLDFASIDIDGQDYWVWRGLVNYRPRIVCIEFSPYGAGAGDGPIPECGIDKPHQAGLKEMLKLAGEKDYTPLCTTYCNIIAVATELLG